MAKRLGLPRSRVTVDPVGGAYWCRPYPHARLGGALICTLGKEAECFDEKFDAQIVRLATAVLSRTFIISDEPAVTVSSPGGRALSAEQENGARS